jgi:hypothetical protein
MRRGSNDGDLVSLGRELQLGSFDSDGLDELPAQSDSLCNTAGSARVLNELDATRANADPVRRRATLDRNVMTSGPAVRVALEWIRGWLEERSKIRICNKTPRG